ncbi:hypothetical protein OROMI_014212 [Orobanche minor]
MPPNISFIQLFMHGSPSEISDDVNSPIFQPQDRHHHLIVFSEASNRYLIFICLMIFRIVFFFLLISIGGPKFSLWCLASIHRIKPYLPQFELILALICIISIHLLVEEKYEIACIRKTMGKYLIGRFSIVQRYFGIQEAVVVHCVFMFCTEKILLLLSLIGSRLWEHLRDILNPEFLIHLVVLLLGFIIQSMHFSSSCLTYLTFGLFLSVLATTSTILDHNFHRINDGFSIGFTSILITVMQFEYLSPTTNDTKRRMYRYPPSCNVPYGPMSGVAGGMLSFPYEMGDMLSRYAAVPQLMPITALASTLANASPEQQRTMLGENLYPLVYHLEHEHAAKVTGMLLEMDQIVVLHLLESPDALKAKISEAMDVLRNIQQSSSPVDQLASLSLNENVVS